MQAIRKRNPFTLDSEDHGNGRAVLDEQGNSPLKRTTPRIDGLTDPQNRQKW